MKKLIPILIILGLVGYILLARGQSNKSSTSSSNPIVNLFKKEIKVGEDVCAEFSKEWIQSATNKSIIKTERFDMTGTHTCKYYVKENSFITIHVEDLNVENQKKGAVLLNRTVKQDSRIKMDHFVVWQGDNQINNIYLVLNPNRFVTVGRSDIEVINNEENIQLAIKVVERIQKGENQGLVSAPTTEPTKEPTKTGNNIVPLPQEKDIINNFFTLIDEGKVSDAVMMMPSIITSDDSTKQAFGVQFSAMKSVKVIKIEESMKEDWTETRHQYMVTLDVVMDPSSAGGPIPYYGFKKGENVRFVGLVKEGNQWKVKGMATGP